MLAANTVAAASLPIARSATGVMVVGTGGLVLLVGFGSPVGEFTVATFVIVPDAGAVTVNVTLVVVFEAKVPRFQLTTPLLLTPPLLALTKLTPTGNASVTTTLLASDGPKFVTEIV